MSSSPSQRGQRKGKIVVVGAGVLGLTTALTLRKRGYEVVIVARDLPTDVTSQNFASPWAGANWRSFGSKKEVDQQRRDADTFKKFQELSQGVLPRTILSPMHFADYSDVPVQSGDVWFEKLVPDFRILPKGSPGAPANAPYGFTYTSFTLNVPEYLRWLVHELQRPDGSLPPVRISRCMTLHSLQTVQYLQPDAKLIINATGLGASDLADVRDETVFPIRGQTILVRAPRVDRCVMAVAKPAAYIIPRARSGEVICGGSFDVKQSGTKPDRALKERILASCVALCPELLPEGLSEEEAKSPDAWKKVEVVATNVGLRPSREGGVRVEAESLDLGEGKKLGVVHAYGIGPAGYQASWGIASEAADLVDKWFADPSNSNTPNSKL